MNLDCGMKSADAMRSAVSAFFWRNDGLVLSCAYARG